MKLTKYPQSCLMVETKGKKILIDPGSLKYEERFLGAWREADIILITHKHSDHVNVGILKMLGVPIYSTAEVKNARPELKINVVKEGDIITLADIKIEVVKAVHGYNPNLKGGNEVFENVGYIIDDGATRFYTTSDTICFNNDYKADVVALPVTAHGLTMSSFEAALFAIELGAKLVIPVHMDNELLPTDFDYMYKNFDRFKINYKMLGTSESVEVEP